MDSFGALLIITNEQIVRTAINMLERKHQMLRFKKGSDWNIWGFEREYQPTQDLHYFFMDRKSGFPTI